MKSLLFQILLFFSFNSIYAQSDVDTRLAINEHCDPNTFVVIISNEHYKYEQPVPFALNDGETFKLYCEKTLGVPVKNIRYVADATLNEMRMQFQWLVKTMNAFEGDARAIVYYSGHGMPSDDGKHSFLLPIDGNSTLEGSGLSTADLYKQLGQMPSRQTLVLLDACFSGARRDGQMLSSSRGVEIDVEQEPVEGKLVVFSAAKGNETAYPYHVMRHGLFSFYLLECLQQNGGCISLGELSDYVIKKVKRMSIVENNKDQTPTIISSITTQDWRNWQFAGNVARRYETLIRTETESPIKNQQTNPSLVISDNEQSQISSFDSISVNEVLGAEICPITEKQRKQLELSYGLSVVRVGNGKMKESGIPGDFIILKANDLRMNSVKDFQDVVKSANMSKEHIIIIKGVYPTGKRGYYVLDIGS